MSAPRTAPAGPATDAIAPRAAIALVALAAVVVYWNSLGNGFALDDVWIVLRNPPVHDLAHPGALWLSPYWPTLGREIGIYRPLTSFLFAIEWRLGGGAPWIFHAVDVLAHAGVSVLVLLLLRRFVDVVPAACGALLFALHPVHTEAVASVVGQAELLAAAAVLAAALLHTRPAAAAAPTAAAPPRPPAAPPRIAAIGAPSRIAVIAALYAAGMLAKENAIVLPALLVALDLALGRAGPSLAGVATYARRAGPLLATLAAVAIAYLALRIHVLGHIAGSDPAPYLPFLRGPHRLLSALRAWPEYARLLVLPLDLSADYSPGVVLPVAALTPAAALGAVLLGGTALLALATPLRPRVGLPAAWVLLAILPVSNLLFPVGVLVAERTLYLPSVGVALAAAFLADAYRRARAAPAAFSARLPLRAAPAAFAVLLTAFAVRTAARNPVWRSTAAVDRSLIRDHPESYRAQWSAAAASFAAGDTAAAGDRFELAYRLWPYDSDMLADYAGFALRTDRPGLAVRLLRRAVALHPAATYASSLLAFALFQDHRYDDALAALRRAEDLAGASGPLLGLRGRALLEIGRPRDAAVALRRSLDFRDPARPLRWAYLARALAAAGDTSAAIHAADSARRAAAALAPTAPPLGALLDSLLAPLKSATDSHNATRLRGRTPADSTG